MESKSSLDSLGTASTGAMDSIVLEEEIDPNYVPGDDVRKDFE